MKGKTKMLLAIPENVDFADLELTYTETGIIFKWEPIEAICKASDIDIALFKECQEDNVANLICVWYFTHLAQGGNRDAAADELITEVLAEDAAGQPFSIPPGKA